MFLKKIFLLFLKSFSFSKNAPLIESGCKGTTFFSFHQMFLKKIFQSSGFSKNCSLIESGCKSNTFYPFHQIFLQLFFNYFVICWFSGRFLSIFCSVKSFKKRCNASYGVVLRPDLSQDCSLILELKNKTYVSKVFISYKITSSSIIFILSFEHLK